MEIEEGGLWTIRGFERDDEVLLGMLLFACFSMLLDINYTDY